MHQTEVAGPSPVVHVMAEENRAIQALTACCWWRRDIPRDVAEAYWRDLHGVLAARIPGLWQYRQLRLAPNRPDLLALDAGVQRDLERAAQPEGIAHGLFLDETDQQAFATSPHVTRDIFADERNFVGRGTTQLSPAGSARTFADRLDVPAVQGPPPAPAYAVFFVAREDLAATHHALRDVVAPAWADHDGVLRVRVVPLDPYDPSGWDSPGVEHARPTGWDYAGWIELAVPDEAALATLVDDLTASAIGKTCQAVHVYPLREVFTIVERGRPTDVGLRGFSAVQTIAATGADNQQDPALLQTIYGDAVLGLEQLGAEPSVDQRRARNVATVRAYYSLQEAMDLDRWLDLWADDGAQSIPYAPDGFPTLVSGKAELRRIYRDLFAGFRSLEIVDLAVDRLLDPDQVLTRWHTRADLVTGGRYDNDLVGLFQFNPDGTISHFTEYFNPTRFNP